MPGKIARTPTAKWNEPTTLTPATYGTPHRYYGGSSVDVTLGVGALDPTKNTGSAKTHGPPAMKQLKQKLGRKVVSGHLLNADLGGVGSLANLTPLSSKTNSTHRKYEGILKRGLRELKQALTRLNRLDLAGSVGINYQVRVKMFKPGKNPERLNRVKAIKVSMSRQNNSKLTGKELDEIFKFTGVSATILNE